MSAFESLFKRVKGRKCISIYALSLLMWLTIRKTNFFSLVFSRSLYKDSFKQKENDSIVECYQIVCQWLQYYVSELSGQGRYNPIFLQFIAGNKTEVQDDLTGTQRYMYLVIGTVRLECWCMSPRFLVSILMVFHLQNMNTPLEKAVPCWSAHYNEVAILQLF